MSYFPNKWVKSSSPTFKEKVKKNIRPASPLKPRLEVATRRIQYQILKIDSILNKLKNKDNSIFNNVIVAVQKHDMLHASVYANELAEIRKMNKMVTQSKIALEQIVLRLHTVQELGDVVVTLTPAVAVIKNLKSGLSNLLPEVDREIDEISNLLSNILVDAGQLGGYTLNFETANEDAEKILLEASVVADQRIKDKFPELTLDGKLSSIQSQE